MASGLARREEAPPGPPEPTRSTRPNSTSCGAPIPKAGVQTFATNRVTGQGRLWQKHQKFQSGRRNRPVRGYACRENVLLIISNSIEEQHSRAKWIHAAIRE